MTSYSRRTIIGSTALGFAAIALFALHAVGSAAPTTQTHGGAANEPAAPVGVQLYSFRDAFKSDVRGTLKRVHDLGFRDVELAGTYGLTAAQFRTLLDSAGLHASSMHVAYEQFRDSLPQVLADAKTLGVRYLGTAWIPHPDGPISVGLAHEAAAHFNAWGRAARERGFQFFYHVHGYEFVPGDKGALPMDVLMRETDPAAVTFEMDVFWATLPGNDPVALLETYPTRWRLMHLKDMKKGVATNVKTGAANADSTEVPVGSGQIDYRGVIRTAKRLGVQKFYLEDETRDPFATVPHSIRWLRGIKI
jgi:sugar phosphate isomerase/epimerase